MKILAIETSCDETAISIIEANGELAEGKQTIITITGEALLSQVALHAQYGGVFPNLAKREHAKNLAPILMQALSEAKLLIPSEENQLSKEAVGELKTLLDREPELFANLVILLSKIEAPQIDAVAVTHGPGLEPALWVGINFAKALSLVWNKPVIPVNHMEGHMLSSTMKEEAGGFVIPEINFPALALLISGGHTEIILMKKWGEYELIGSTRDDAVGEAFDKVARMLDLPYPGGPEVSRLANIARANKVERLFKLPRPMIDSKDFDFSFSGLKTAVLYQVKEKGSLSDIEKQALAREFEDAVAEVLLKKIKDAIEEYSARSIIIGGGVSANEHIRNVFNKEFENNEHTDLYLPAPNLTTDNATMIAVAGFLRSKLGNITPLADIRAEGGLMVA